MVTAYKEKVSISMRLATFIFQQKNKRNVWTMRLVCDNPNDTADISVLSGLDESLNQRIPWTSIRNSILNRSETLERIDTFSEEGVLIGSYTIEFPEEIEENEEILPIPAIAEKPDEKEFERFLNIMLKAQESNIKQLVSVVDAVLKPIMGNFNATLKEQATRVERMEKQQVATQNKWFEAVEAQANADAGNNSILESVAPVLGALISGQKGD